MKKKGKIEALNQIDWEGFFSNLNEQERDVIIVITLNNIIRWINEHEEKS